MKSRRAFALLAAIGVLAVVALIVVALADSVSSERQVLRRWRDSGEERLMLRHAVETIRARMAAGEAAPDFTEQWGAVPIRVTASPASPDFPGYTHPALAPRPGDVAALVEIGARRRHLLLRGEPAPSHHVLPEDLFHAEETAP